MKQTISDFEKPTSAGLVSAVLLVFVLLCANVSANAFQVTSTTKKAPEFEGAKGWLNTDSPLSLKGLRGKVVLLDFWTYGCVNCIHVLPDLKYLEEKYKKELVVIGVHSAKFKNEAEQNNLRQIILRYGIEHPVVNDADFRIWRSYGVRAWPTQVLIDPDGNIIGAVAGEGHRELLDRIIGTTVEIFRQKGRLNEKPLSIVLEKSKVGSLPLAFPGKVYADEESKRLFIADSNHNRIVITDFAGKLLDVVGNGNPSFVDGSFSVAGFRKPQGMVLSGNKLFVADTENHSIRQIDLKSRAVSTIAGTGSLKGFNGFGGKALETSLRSPWDVEIVDRFLFVAMAGSHQIWRLNLNTGKIAPYAGNRHESRKDGPIKLSNFAQPSGIASDGNNLFVADSESNIIRSINFEKEAVKTLVGGDLFEFGDIDGTGDTVRLQHPLGIDTYRGTILIADTYNHKIKLLNKKTNTVTTLVGSGNEGQTDGSKASFYEPGGISVTGNRLFVADTNNHAVRVVDLKTRQVSTLAITGLAPPKFAETSREVIPNRLLLIPQPQVVRISKDNAIEFDVSLPKGFHLNPIAPQRYDLSLTTAGNKSIDIKRRAFTKLPLTVPISVGKRSTSDLTARLNIYYCRKDNTGVCYIKSIEWNVKVEFTNKQTASNRLLLKAIVD